METAKLNSLSWNDDDGRPVESTGGQYEDQFSWDETLRRIDRLIDLARAQLEAEAYRVLLPALEERGYHLVENYCPVDVHDDIDVIALVKSPEGKQLWVLAPARRQVRRKEVKQWFDLLNDQSFRERLHNQLGIEPPYLPYVYGYRVFKAAMNMAQDLGLGVLDRTGERVPPTVWTTRRWMVPSSCRPIIP